MIPFSKLVDSASENTVSSHFEDVLLNSSVRRMKSGVLAGLRKSNMPKNSPVLTEEASTLL